MTLTPGARLGAYEVIVLIGAGGMGEVYRARDTRLGREVAIKVLPAGLSADPERLSRFEQEARAAATLNHPNILAVYDIGAHPSTGAGQASAPFIVSELLEGETLREKLSHGPLPVRKAIELGIQIAHGLSAAHEKGIVHRDLKPENLFITNDGRAKILDFGLAKLTQPDGAMAATSNMPTTPVQTQHGMVLGTIGYMAPEQVRGLTADHRADIFAFGAVLYEMLSGQRAFKGDTTADTMSAILKDDPPDLPMADRHIPPALARIIDRCLEKNPASRFGTAGDLAFALDALSTHSGMAPALAAGTAEPRKRSRERLAWMALATCLLGLAAALPFTIAHLRETPVVPEVVRFSVPPPPDEALGPALAISPDGKHLAFVAAGASIWVRSLDSFDARPLAGTDGGQGVFWSPDSRFIAFFAQGKLKKIELTGGPAQTLCDAAGIGGFGAWNHDGVIVFSRPTGTTGVFRVSAAGGQPTRLTTPDASRKEAIHSVGSFLPGGRRFLYGALPSGKIYVSALDGSGGKELTNANSKGVYAAPGYLLFSRQGTLMAQRFDVDGPELIGEAVPIAEQLAAGPGGSAFTVSDSGVLAYRAGFSGMSFQVTSVDRSGKVVKTVGEPGDYRDINLSPDGTRVMVHRHEDPLGGGLWVLDTVRGTTSRFTFDQSHNVQAQWSPDGGRVAFGSNRDGVINIYQKISSGAGPDELLLKSSLNTGPTDWSRDGRYIVYDTEGPKTQMDIWVLPLAGDRKPISFLQTEFSEGQARLSPDSRWMAYVSNETGRNEVYVQPFPPSGGKWQISTNGGVQPRWRRDGKELYYLTAANAGLATVTAVDVNASQASVMAGSPKALFSARFSPGIALSGQGLSANVISQSYVASSDGQRFVLLTPTGDVAPAAVKIVLNWTGALKK